MLDESGWSYLCQSLIFFASLEIHTFDLTCNVTPLPEHTCHHMNTYFFTVLICPKTFSLFHTRLHVLNEIISSQKNIISIATVVILLWPTRLLLSEYATLEIGL